MIKDTIEKEINDALSGLKERVSQNEYAVVRIALMTGMILGAKVVLKQLLEEQPANPFISTFGKAYSESGYELHRQYAEEDT